MGLVAASVRQSFSEKLQGEETRGAGDNNSAKPSRRQSTKLRHLGQAQDGNDEAQRRAD